MIVEGALSNAQWQILQAVRLGLLDENTDLPDEVLSALHRDDTVEKAGNADHLKRYWAHGAGAKKIGWGSKGDFARCVAAVGRHMDDPEGYCNLRHKDAAGEYPGQHAARERGKSKAHKAIRVQEIDEAEEPTVTKAIRVMEKHLPGQHNQQAHAGGRIGTHTGMRVGETKDDAKAQARLLDDPTAMAALPIELQDQMHACAASMGVTQADLEANIEATLQRAGGPTAPGHDWYEQANRECAAVGKDAGIPHEQAVGMVAAISPQMAWGPNLAVARYLAENKDQPVNTALLSEPLSKRVGAVGQSRVETRTRYEWAQAEVHGRNLDGQLRVMPTVGSLEGKKFSDLDPYVAASLLKAHAQAGVGLFNGKPLSKQLSIADDITGKMTKVNFPGTIQTGRGLRIARGEDTNTIINGHKVRSFRNNMLLPTDRHGDITVDSHAVSLALGRKISSSSPEYAAFTGGRKKGSTLTPGPTSAPLGVKGAYALWADAYRNVAARHGIRPNQLQSITWIQWRKEHPDNARTAHGMDKASW